MAAAAPWPGRAWPSSKTRPCRRRQPGPVPPAISRVAPTFSSSRAHHGTCPGLTKRSRSEDASCGPARAVPRQLVARRRSGDGVFQGPGGAGLTPSFPPMRRRDARGRRAPESRWPRAEALSKQSAGSRAGQGKMCAPASTSFIRCVIGHLDLCAFA
jgi:hypothetical protein